MKIGIMTINSAYNYGCVLQAWSLQKYLEKIGHEVHIINYRIPEIDNTYRLFQAKKRFSLPPLNWIWNKLRYAKFRATQQPRIKKAAKFEHFINEVMHTTRVYSSFRELEREEAGKEYDVLVTGSDQVWNSSITKGLKPAYFLGFDRTKKKISYAASIGKLTMTKAEQGFFEEFLGEYSNIAVREHSAKQLLAPLVKSSVSVVVDPTLLLERSDFDAMKQPSRFPTPYILVHVIGKDRKLKEIVDFVSEQTGLPVVQNRMAKQFLNELGCFADAGPEEFLGLVEGAKLVITNSFHATIFSIIYEVNFITVPHKKYPERMVNLLQETGLENHLIASVEELPEEISDLMPDYEEVKMRLQVRKEESKKYLEEALKTGL